MRAIEKVHLKKRWVYILAADSLMSKDGKKVFHPEPEVNAEIEKNRKILENSPELQKKIQEIIHSYIGFSKEEVCAMLLALHEDDDEIIEVEVKE